MLREVSVLPTGVTSCLVCPSPRGFLTTLDVQHKNQQCSGNARVSWYTTGYPRRGTVLERRQRQLLDVWDRSRSRFRWMVPHC